MSSPEEPKYPCYAIAEGVEIRQGDLLDRCPVVIPSADAVKEIETQAPRLSAYIEHYDIVVMSQSCDLMYDKVDLVLVCPVWTYEKLALQHGHLLKYEVKVNLKRGNLPGYHLLHECSIDGFARSVSVVDFRSVYGLPLDFIKYCARDRSPRVRLMPPYREHPAQAFARFFMRVGLPSDAALP